MKFIKQFKQLGMNDTALVGGKTASLGQMFNNLSQKGVRVPDGFAITSQAYWRFLLHNQLIEPINQRIVALNVHDLQSLKENALAIRRLFLNAEIPLDVAQEIKQAYTALSQEYNQEDLDVAVRSSATAEDLPGASFAGQQESFLHIQGIEMLLDICKQCFASLFTDRAIIYRVTKGFDHAKIALSIAVQKMVRSDLAVAGVGFSLDPETGFKDVIIIDASYGLGEAVVQGIINPDEFTVFKPTLKAGYDPIIQKNLGNKKKKLIYGNQGSLEWVTLEDELSQQFCLSDKEVIELATIILIIEDHYSNLHGSWSPMDVEWAKDGIDGKLYIVQARPETVHAIKKSSFVQKFILDPIQKNPLKIIAEGVSIGSKIATGKARIVKRVKDIDQFNEGDILVTYMTDPDWVPLMQKAAGIVTEAGGRTCHAAIVSRELGIPAIIGAPDIIKRIKDGQLISLDCSQGSQGFIYDGQISYSIEDIDIKKLSTPPVRLMVNMADPDNAFNVSQLPFISGVGLARSEFIITNRIKAHPMAFVETEKITDPLIIQKIEDLTSNYANKQDYFVDALAEGIATIAAAFYPNDVIVRFSDFKTNEYRELLGGSYFEPIESNPMLGLRGASRYYNPLYEPAFGLECKAMKKARDIMGLTNIISMIPFVRTLDEAWRVVTIMKRNGLIQGENGFKIYMMVEIPSNVLLIDDFAKLFDGFSIGSNDLTQTTLAVDRDSSLLAPLFDERDKAIKKMCSMVIQGALEHSKPIGICGQAPSDYHEFGKFLIEKGITSISLNPDSVLSFLNYYSHNN